MPNAAWRCEHPNGDVKYAVREAHVDILELKGYVCSLDPDPQFDEYRDKVFVPELENE